MDSETNCAVLFFNIRFYQGFLTARLVSLAPFSSLGKSDRSVTGILAPDLRNHFPALCRDCLPICTWEAGGASCGFCSSRTDQSGWAWAELGRVLTSHFLAGRAWEDPFTL